MSNADMLSRRFEFSEEVKARVPFFRVWCLYEIFYAAHFGKPIAMKGGRYKLKDCAGMSFESDAEMLKKMYYAIDVEQAKATVLSDRTMIFGKIHSFEGGVVGFNSRVRGVISGARAACKYPALQCAACGDTTAIAEVRMRPEKYFPFAAAAGFLAVMEGQAHKLSHRE